MKATSVIWLLIVITLPSLVLAEAAPEKSAGGPARLGSAATGAHIATFSVATEGSLHIVYSDGTEVEIPKERGRFAKGEQIIAQETFSNIQVADDRRHIGWLADYMMCAQSYPCSMELVIYQSAQKLQYILPPYGIMWRWRFLDGGKRVVVQGGFAHGDDTGAYVLYDTDTGRELAKFSSTTKKAPKWVQQSFSE